MKFLITAGPTREWIDPVRFISNPSTGKMGYALAQAAQEAGAEVLLVSGPTVLPDPKGVKTVRVETAAEMAAAVFKQADLADIIILSAAVADWTPERRARQKIAKSSCPDRLTLRLRRTVDIAATLGQQGLKHTVLVGFAAETSQLERKALDKLRRKRFDFIVANDVSQPGVGFGSDSNQVCLIDKDGRIERPARASKLSLARRIVKRALAIHSSKRKQT